MLSNIVRLYHTIRYLRPVQIYGRLWFRLYQPLPRQQKTPPIRSRRTRWTEGALLPAMMLSANRFIFLNEEGIVSTAEDWNHTEKSKLWLYNLHYFNDLNAENARERISWHQNLIKRWIQENPPVAGNGWEPYPVSLRIVNWIKWAQKDNDLEPDWENSLALQARYLRKRIEFHLLGNHLFANAKALIFAGMYFEGDEAEEWLNKGLSILKQQIPEQILADGGHFELSPMYHSIILNDLLDLINLLHAYSFTEKLSKYVNRWKTTAQQMICWLNLMCHPDREISFFNDSTMGVASSPDKLNIYTQALGIKQNDNKGVRGMLEESGYVRFDKGSAVLLLDAGNIGPDYLPGHAHADTLSFELSLFERRVIVNSGISCYGNSAERLKQRGTGSHSTVAIDDEDSSEVWGSFRVARRARALELLLTETEGSLKFECSHNGYTRLPGKPIHHRSWVLEEDSLVLEDRVSGQFDHAISRLFLHPDVRIEYNQNKNTGTIILKDGECLIWGVSGGTATICDSMYHPGFGLNRTNKIIEVVFDSSVITFTLTWSMQ